MNTRKPHDEQTPSTIPWREWVLFVILCGLGGVLLWSSMADFFALMHARAAHANLVSLFKYDFRMAVISLPIFMLGLLVFAGSLPKLRQSKKLIKLSGWVLLSIAISIPIGMFGNFIFRDYISHWLVQKGYHPCPTEGLDLHHYTVDWWLTDRAECPSSKDYLAREKISGH